MTDPRETLARIRKQADAATDGPWETYTITPHMGSEVLTAPEEGEEYGDYVVPEYIDTADAEFIAAARTTVPALLDALEAAIRVHHLSEFHTFTGPVPWCDECDCTYPCPTVDAITTALEGLHHA